MSATIRMSELKSEWDRLLGSKERPTGFKSIAEIAREQAPPLTISEAANRVDKLLAAGKLEMVEGVFDGRRKRLFKPKISRK